MSLLPPAQTPLNQHSLLALELWLKKIGAERKSKDPSLWTLIRPEWSAEIRMEKEELRVTWEQEGMKKQRCFPYGLSRDDAEAAISEGP